MRRTVLIASTAMLTAFAAAADVRISPEDGANHSYPAVCRQPAGFVVAWEADGEDGREIRVEHLDEYGFTFSLDGSFRANQENAGNQQLPDIACREDGSFLVVWESQAQDGDGLGIFARDFAADGTPRGDEFRVNTHTADNQHLPRVCVDSSGRAVVVWQTYGQGAEHPRVFGQRFDAGSPSGAEFSVEDIAAAEQTDPAVACGVDGAFAVAWASRGTESGSQIWVRLFDADGLPVSHAAIPNTPDAVQRRHPAVAHNPLLPIDNTLALAFDADGQIQAGEIALDENSPGADVRLNELFSIGRNEAPAVAGHGVTEIFVAWSSGSVFDFSLEGARTKHRADSRIFSVSSTDGANQGANSPIGRGIDIATAPDGDLVVWQQRNVFADDSSSAIYARRFRDCIGDCSDDGVVTINELITGVRIALNLTQATVDTCSRLDANASGRVEINELVRAVTEALARICPAPVN